MRFFLIAAMLIILFSTSYSQTLSTDNRLYITVQSGWNYSSMHGSEIDALKRDFNSSPIFMMQGIGSIYFNYFVNNHFLLNAGIKKEGKGYKFPISTLSGTDPYGNDLKYTLYQQRNITSIDIPVGLSYKIGRKYLLSIKCGLSPSFVISAFDKYVEETTTSKVLQNRDLFKNVNIIDSLGNTIHYNFNDFHGRFDLNLILGFETEKRFNHVGLFLGFQYIAGLLNFNQLSQKARSELAVFHQSDYSKIAFGNLDNSSSYFLNYQFNFGINIYIKNKSDIPEH
jgi:hypothetical protein